MAVAPAAAGFVTTTSNYTVDPAARETPVPSANRKVLATVSMVQVPANGFEGFRRMHRDPAVTVYVAGNPTLMDPGEARTSFIVNVNM